MFHPSELKAMKAAQRNRTKFATTSKPKIVAGSFIGSYAVVLADGTRINCANYSTAQYYVRLHSK
jgi:hypothetical protein